MKAGSKCNWQVSLISQVVQTMFPTEGHKVRICRRYFGEYVFRSSFEVAMGNGHIAGLVLLVANRYLEKRGLSKPRHAAGTYFLRGRGIIALLCNTNLQEKYTAY